MNLCVTYSQLGKHDMALMNGRSAMLFIQGEVADILKSEGDKTKNNARLVVYVIALHNIAVEYEHLKHVVALLG